MLFISWAYTVQSSRHQTQCHLYPLNPKLDCHHEGPAWISLIGKFHARFFFLFLTSQESHTKSTINVLHLWITVIVNLGILGRCELHPLLFLLLNKQSRSSQKLLHHYKFIVIYSAGASWSILVTQWLPHPLFLTLLFAGCVACFLLGKAFCCICALIGLLT